MATLSAPRSEVAPRDRLIVALDVASVDEARALVARIGDAAGVFKIGMQLQFAGGLEFARELIDAGRRVFLDAKLFDIDETVERAVRNVAAMGVDFLTVHGNRRTVPAAVRGRGDSALKILAVTVLTSLDEADMIDIYGEGARVEDFVRARAEKALEAGADGVVASGHEAEMIAGLAADRLRLIDTTRGFSVVTPGIRPPSDDAGDQKRVATPYAAITAGADYLVVGRPVYQAADPRAAAEAVVADIARALGDR